jgi:hypothetical protein
MKNELNTCFEQKFATGSYGVGIGRAWCSRKACEICSSLVQKKKLKKNYFSSHKLPKQQSTSFWSQGILGVNTTACQSGAKSSSGSRETSKSLQDTWPIRLYRNQGCFAE